MNDHDEHQQMHCNQGRTCTCGLHHAQREILRHALGLGRGQREYRNHFVTGPGSTDYSHCEALVASGLMLKRAGNPLSGGNPVYQVTAAGRMAARGAVPAGDAK